MNIEMVKIEDLIEADWGVTAMTAREERALIRSLKTYGWVQPIVVLPTYTFKAAYLVIDGFQRLRLLKTIAFLRKQLGETVPCVVISESSTRENMLLAHLALNTVRGSRIAALMSRAIKELTATLTPGEIASALGLHEKTVLDLQQNAAFAMPRDTYRYNRAWYPSDSGTEG